MFVLNLELGTRKDMLFRIETYPELWWYEPEKRSRNPNSRDGYISGEEHQMEI